MVNEGFRLLGEGSSLRPEDIDVMFVQGGCGGFHRYLGGPMWWAERDVGLANVAKGLIGLATRFPGNPQFQCAQLLKEVAASGATIREEMYFARKGAETAAPSSR